LGLWTKNSSFHSIIQNPCHSLAIISTSSSPTPLPPSRLVATVYRRLKQPLAIAFPYRSGYQSFWFMDHLLKNKYPMDLFAMLHDQLVKTVLGIRVGEWTQRDVQS